MFPSEATARGWTQLSQIATHIGLRDAALVALQEKTGDLGDDIRNFALLPDGVLRQAVAASRTTVEVDEQNVEVSLTPIDAAQVGLTWRIARRLMTSGTAGWDGYVDQDPMVAQPQQQQNAGPQVPQGLLALTNIASAGPDSERKLKMSSYIDQADDGEFIPASRQQVETWFQNYQTFAAGPPLEQEEPTAEQLQALNTRANVRNQSPYADLSIWGPFNRKIARAMKNVRDVTSAWVARGGRGVPLSPEEQLAQSHLGGRQNLSAPQDSSAGQGGQARPWGEGSSRGALQRKRKRDFASGSAQPPQRQDRSSGKAKDRGKDKTQKGKTKGGKRAVKHTKDSAGTAVCFAWGSKSGQCAGDVPCPFNRARVCQWGLASDLRTMECS